MSHGGDSEVGSDGPNKEQSFSPFFAIFLAWHAKMKILESDKNEPEFISHRVQLPCRLFDH